ncbi:TPA: hypothetical protein ACNGY6_002761 [Klebsiella variicola subsp. variicola]
MTSKLTRERIELIANFHRAMALPPSHAEIEELARMALAAMDSEPHTDDELSNLLWYSQEATCHSDPNYYCEFQRLATPGLIAGIIRELQERRKADSEPVENHIGSKNSLDAIVSFIKSKSNPTVKCYEEVSEQLFKDNCHGIHSHVIEYILKLGEELEDFRAEQAEMPPAQPAADSEPVAWTWQHLKQWYVTNDEERARELAWDGVKVEQLYRHAQQPVVSADLLHTAVSAIEDLLTNKDRTGAGVWFDLPFRLRSAANEQTAPVVPDEATAEDCPAFVKYDVTGIDEAWACGFNACRAAMLNGGKS